MGWEYSDWAPYVPVEERRHKAHEAAAKLAGQQNRAPQPVVGSGSKLAKTFWGRAWCDHLHAFRDYANRLPRGATYLRNGSVVDLVLREGRIDALVAGSETYKIAITIHPLQKKRWQEIRKKCSRSIDSLLDLLAGRLSDGMMRVLTDRQAGLFPTPGEIRMKCSCPDSARVCKHLAAVMYGVGVRLDTQPELLFQLRGVNHQDLVSEVVTEDTLERELGGQSRGSLGDADLGEMFGIELALPGESGSLPTKRTPSQAGGGKSGGKRGGRATGGTQGQRPAATVIEGTAVAIPEESGAEEATFRSAAVRQRSSAKATGRLKDSPVSRKPGLAKVSVKTVAGNKAAAKTSGAKTLRRTKSSATKTTGTKATAKKTARKKTVSKKTARKKTTLKKRP